MLKLIIVLVLSSYLYTKSNVQKAFKDLGPRPYNYRVIDGFLHAGGNPLSPRGKNSDKKVRAILHYLKQHGVEYVLTLDGSRRSRRRLPKLIKQAGLKQINMFMNASKVPTRKEWASLKKLMRKKVGIYVHCTWGADRTGAIIGRYLVDIKRYNGYRAWKAVISRGSHAGPRGGLKRKRAYRKMVTFFWQSVALDNKKVARIYGITR